MVNFGFWGVQQSEVRIWIGKSDSSLAISSFSISKLKISKLEQAGSYDAGKAIA